MVLVVHVNSLCSDFSGFNSFTEQLHACRLMKLACKTSFRVRGFGVLQKPTHTGGRFLQNRHGHAATHTAHYIQAPPTCVQMKSSLNHPAFKKYGM